MATNYKNSIYKNISGLQTVPESADGTGTITTQGTVVVGVGTRFLSEMPKGSWLCSLSATEIRKVVSVQSDTVANIEEAFTAELVAVAPNIIHEDDTGIVTISVCIPSGEADGLVDGEVFPGGVSLTISKDGRMTSSTRDVIDPLIVDGSGTTMLITINK